MINSYAELHEFRNYPVNGAYMDPATLAYLQSRWDIMAVQWEKMGGIAQHITTTPEIQEELNTYSEEELPDYVVWGMVIGARAPNMPRTGILDGVEFVAGEENPKYELADAYHEFVRAAVAYVALENALWGIA